MWKCIKDMGNVVKDMAVIASKEVVHQTRQASKTTSSATSKLATRTRELREAYEINLASRKEGVDGELIVSKHQSEEA